VDNKKNLRRIIDITTYVFYEKVWDYVLLNCKINEETISEIKVPQTIEFIDIRKNMLTR
jgi:hypothetical protein